MILALIKTLQPDIFVLATGMFKQIDESLSKSMQIIIPYDDVFAMNHTDLYAGILLAFDETTEKLTDLMIKKEKIAHLNTPCYFSGSFSLQLHQQLKNLILKIQKTSLPLNFFQLINEFHLLRMLKRFR